MNPIAYINVEERKLEWAGPVEWGTPTIAKMDKVPLYIHQYIDLTDAEIDEIWREFDDKDADDWFVAITRAILRAAQDK